MKQVTVNHTGPNEIMNIVDEMRKAGMVQGKDFDFAFYQSKWDEFTGEDTRHTVFTFYDEKWATFFMLRWV